MSEQPTPITPIGDSADPDLVSLREQAIAVKVLSELVKTADANVRARLLQPMLEQYRATGETRFDAAAFGMTGIGTFTLPERADKAVVEDPEAFLDYVEENHPAHVETIVQPVAAWQKAFLSSLTLTDEGPVNPLTGQVVPGLRVERGGDPTKFNVNLTKATIGQVTAAVMGHTVAALTEAANPALALTPAAQDGAV